jgi:hypothetical protein
LLPTNPISKFKNNFFRFSQLLKLSKSNEEKMQEYDLKRKLTFCLVLISIILLNINFASSVLCPSNTWQCENGIQCINETLKCDNGEIFNI